LSATEKGRPSGKNATGAKILRTQQTYFNREYTTTELQENCQDGRVGNKDIL